MRRTTRLTLFLLALWSTGDRRLCAQAPTVSAWTEQFSIPGLLTESSAPLPPASAPATTAPVPTSPLPASEEVSPKDRTWEMIFNHGLYFQTRDKSFSIHPLTTFQYDGAWYSGDRDLQDRPLSNGAGGTGRFLDGMNFRRGRFRLEGHLYKNLEFKFELDFAAGIGFSPAGTQGNVVASSVVNSPTPTVAYIRYTEVPFLGNVTVGNQKEWFSLEHLDSERNLLFMERSYLFDFTQLSAFNSGFSPGIGLHRTWAQSRLFSGIGMYKNESDQLGFGIGNGQYAVTGRLAALPIWDKEEERHWEVGGSYSHRDPVDDQVQMRIRNNVRNAPAPLLNLLLNTGQIPTRSQDVFNVETIYVDGPFTFMGEYTANVLRGVSNTREPTGPNLGTYVFQGAYASLTYFLTGEYRPWSADEFRMGRITPKKNFAFSRTGFGVDGWGAWEVGVRYSYLCLSDKTIQTGQLNSATLGVNWYLNPNCRVMFDYDYAYRSHNADPLAHGALHSFGSRIGFDF